MVTSVSIIYNSVLKSLKIFIMYEVIYFVSKDFPSQFLCLCGQFRLFCGLWKGG